MRQHRSMQQMPMQHRSMQQMPMSMMRDELVEMELHNGNMQMIPVSQARHMGFEHNTMMMQPDMMMGARMPVNMNIPMDMNIPMEMGQIVEVGPPVMEMGPPIAGLDMGNQFDMAPMNVMPMQPMHMQSEEPLVEVIFPNGEAQVCQPACVPPQNVCCLLSCTWP
jgi:hypothetical protein